MPQTSTGEHAVEFGRELSSGEIDTLLSDDKPHALLILFEGHVQIRVKHANGQIRGLKDGNGFWAPVEQSQLLARLERALSAHELSYIRSLTTPTQLPDALASIANAPEGSSFHRTLSQAAPDRDLYAVVEMSVYRPEAMKSLALNIQELEFVREISLLGAVETPKVKLH